MGPLRIVTLALSVVGSLSAEKLVGEHGQAVLGCQCKGKEGGTHGYCGYHINAFSDSDKPWCRTKYKCGYQGMRGSWAYCPEQSVEMRMATDGKYFHVKDFSKFY